MSFPAYPQPLFTGFFDEDMINVPQAQDPFLYAGQTLLDEELGLINAYEPAPLRDEHDLAAEILRPLCKQKARVVSTLGGIKMEALDNGSGRLRGSSAFVRAARARDAMDDDARERSLQAEQFSRVLGSASTAWRARNGPIVSPTKMRFRDADAQAQARAAPRTVYHASKDTSSYRVDAPDFSVPRMHFTCDGVYPTPALLHSSGVADGCIDPVLLDPSAWHTDYRREGLEEMIGSSFVFPRSDVAIAQPIAAPKKSLATTKKVAKIVSAIKQKTTPKKTAKQVKIAGQMSAKPKSTVAVQIFGRRNSFAARSEI